MFPSPSPPLPPSHDVACSVLSMLWSIHWPWLCHMASLPPATATSFQLPVRAAAIIGKGIGHTTLREECCKCAYKGELIGQLWGRKVKCHLHVKKNFIRFSFRSRIKVCMCTKGDVLGGIQGVAWVQMWGCIGTLQEQGEGEQGYKKELIGSRPVATNMSKKSAALRPRTRLLLYKLVGWCLLIIS